MFNINLTLVSLLASFERLSFYSLRAILLLYLINILNIPDARAQELFGGYAALSWLTSLIGGYIADHYLGAKKTTILGSITILIGHLLLFFDSQNISNIIFSLSAISLGTGLFKPCILTLVGETFRNNPDQRTQGFRFFHVFFNACLIPCLMLVGYIYKIEPHYAFTLAAFSMILSFIISFVYWDNFTNSKEQEQLSSDNNYFTIIAFIIPIIIYLQYIILMNWHLFNILYFTIAIIMIAYLHHIRSIQKTETDKNNIIIVVFVVMVMCIVSALEVQINKVMLIFSDRNVHMNFLGLFPITPVFFESLDPFSVLTIGGLLAYFSRQETIANINYKIIYTCGSLILGFALLYFACFTYDEQYKINAIYLSIAVILLLTSQIIFYPFMLSMANSLAPKGYNTFSGAIACFGLSFGRYFGILISKLAAIPEHVDKSDPSQTLFIYQNFFMQLIVLSILVLLASLIVLNFTPLNRVVFNNEK